MFDEVFVDHEASSLRPELKATLTFLKKLTLSPEEVTRSDVAPLYALGLSKRHVEDAVRVCAAFQVINRLADSLEFHVPDEKSFRKSGKFLYKRGYGV